LVIVDAFSYLDSESYVVVFSQQDLERRVVTLGLWAHAKVLHVLGGLLGDPPALVVVGTGPFQLFLEVGSVPFQGNVVDVGTSLSSIAYVDAVGTGMKTRLLEARLGNARIYGSRALPLQTIPLSFSSQGVSRPFRTISASSRSGL
jgi:hypothetical protein